MTVYEGLGPSIVLFRTQTIRPEPHGLGLHPKRGKTMYEAETYAKPAIDETVKVEALLTFGKFAAHQGGGGGGSQGGGAS